MENIERRNGYLYLKYSEPYHLEKFITISRQVYNICLAENYHKVLVDISNMPGKIKTMERFTIGVEGALIFREKVKIAVLYRPEEIDKFAETVGVNRGLNGRIFSDIDGALKWLEVDENGSN